MTKKKFNVGDRVVFRRWDDMEEEFGMSSCNSIACKRSFPRDMEYLCGKSFTIDGFFSNGDVRGAESLFGSRNWHISTDMIELEDSCEMIEAESNNKEIDAFLECYLKTTVD